jgi:hypothetical protein
MSYVHDIAKAKNIPIIDATSPIMIGVAVDDIKKAKAKNSKCCAFARAAQHEPGVVAAYFFRSMAFLEYPDRMVRYALPADARTEIVSFDRAGVMAPGEYRLAPVPKSQKLASLRRYDKKKRRKQAAKTAPVRATPLIEHVGLVRSDGGTPPLPGEPQVARRVRTEPKYMRDLSEPKW